MKIKDPLALAVALACISLGSTTDIHLDSSCNIWGGSPNYIDDYDTYWIYWNGNSVQTNCEIQFTGGSSSIDTDEYQICVSVVDYSVNDCNVKLKYYSYTDIYPDKTYTCIDYPSKFCAASGEDLYIGLSKGYNSLKNNAGSFELMVTASKTDIEEYGVIIGWSVGASIGATVFIVVIIVVLRIRRRRPLIIASRPINNLGTHATVVTSSTSSGYNQQVVQPPPYPGPTPVYNTSQGYPYPTGQKY